MCSLDVLRLSSAKLLSEYIAFCQYQKPFCWSAPAIKNDGLALFLNKINNFCWFFQMKETVLLFIPMSSIPSGEKLQKTKRNYTIEAVSRCVDVLDAFMAGGPQLTLSQIAGITGMNKNGVFRLLHTMVQGALLDKDEETGFYRLSLKLVQLGKLARESENLRHLAVPIMKELWRDHQETVNLGVLRKNQLILVEVFECPHPLRLSEVPGGVPPIHATALGKAVLSVMTEKERREFLTPGRLERFTDKTITEWTRLRRELEITKQRGWSIDDEENLIGARCVAAPIMNGGGHVLGAISVSGPASRLPDDKIENVGRDLAEKCKILSSLL